MREYSFFLDKKKTHTHIIIIIKAKNLAATNKKSEKQNEVKKRKSNSHIKKNKSFGTMSKREWGKSEIASRNESLPFSLLLFRCLNAF